MRDLIKPTIILFLVCTIATFALALTNYATKDTIARQVKMEEENARKEVFSSADSFEEIKDLSLVAGISGNESLVKKAFNSLKSGEVTGRVFLVESKGYGGTIAITVGIDNSGKTTGVKIVSHSETPGLGSKAGENPFISQLIGITPKEPLTVVKSGGSKEEEIDSISGATITSKAVVKAVQAAVEVDNELKKRGGNS